MRPKYRMSLAMHDGSYSLGTILWALWRAGYLRRIIFCILTFGLLKAHR